MNTICQQPPAADRVCTARVGSPPYAQVTSCSSPLGCSKEALSTPVAIKAQSFMTVPYNLYYGPFHLEADSDLSTARVTLRTARVAEIVLLCPERHIDGHYCVHTTALVYTTEVGLVESFATKAMEPWLKVLSVKVLM